MVILLEDVFKEIDAVLEKMQAALREEREQDPEYYDKYLPMQLITVAEEQVLRSVTDKWRLPEEYLYFLGRYVPELVSWSTDEYISLSIYGAKDILP